ncbi:MAG: SixA phosphatase family protein [Thermoanaerobaculia bacterium]
MKPVLALLVLLLLPSPRVLGGEAEGKATPVTTVIFVRHAEKMPDIDNPPLTPVGRARAGELANVLRDAGITAIYTTSWARTRETAEPVAKLLGVTPVVFDGKASEIAQAIRETHRGRTVLVVGHSNTIPDIIAALGVARPPTIGDGEHDGLFVCAVGAEGQAHLLTLRYGARE